MKKICVWLIVIIFLPIFSASLQSQSAIVTTGKSISSSGGSVSYTIGQIAYTTQTGYGGTVAQGIQQAYEIIVVTGVEVKEINLQCLVYPNPAEEFLNLKVENYKFGQLRYQLFDVGGKLLKENTIDGTETTILLENLKPAAYFLKVIDQSKEIKIFKVIKN